MNWLYGEDGEDATTTLLLAHVRDLTIEISLVANGVPKLQAHFRRRKQDAITRILLQERKECIAAKGIQRAFKGYKLSKFYDERLRVHLLKKKEVNAAIVVQRYYRGHSGRSFAFHRRYECEIIALRTKQRNAKRGKATVAIQSLVRGVLQRIKVQKIRNRLEMTNLIFSRQTLSSIVIQKVFRGFVGRSKANRLHEGLILQEEQWFRARQIQCAWKVASARQIFAHLQYFKQIKIHQGKALKLQSIWRARLAGQRIGVLRGLRDLRRREKEASVTIQRIYRGMKGRHRAAGARACGLGRLRRSQAAIVIQQMYTEYKGKEANFVASKLISIEWKAKPIRDQIAEQDRHIADCESALSETKDCLGSEGRILEDLKKEFHTVSKTRKTYVDSTIVNGVLQRCAKTLVVVRRSMRDSTFAVVLYLVLIIILVYPGTGDETNTDQVG